MAQQQQNWSAENATSAYLQALQMGKKGRFDEEPDVSEFISAVAAGNNARLMIIIFGATSKININNNRPTSVSPILALNAAAQHTGGHVVCIFPSLNDLEAASTSSDLQTNTRPSDIECVIGDAGKLLTSDYRDADFVLVDCAAVVHHEEILQTMQQLYRKKKEVVFLGYNACCSGSWRCSNRLKDSGIKTQLLPIGRGLLVARFGGAEGVRRKGSWVVRVDEVTGEEHVFRVKSPPVKGI